MEEANKKFLLPSTCFIVCDQPFSTLFERRIKEISSTYNLSHIIFVDPSKLMEYIEINNEVKRNEFIMIESIFFENAHVNL
jgi:hypothetical protein